MKCYYCGARLEEDGYTLAKLTGRQTELEEALRAILRLEGAYPLSTFPEPDLQKARELLEAGGETLDRVSASNMRHALKVVCKIAREALEGR